MKIIRVKKKDADQNFKECKKKLKDAWQDVTDSLNEVLDVGDNAFSLSHELKLSLYNDYSAVLSQALNLVQNIKRLQKELVK